MSITTIEAFVEDGQIRLPSDVCLPEKTKVYASYIGSPRLAHSEQAADFEKEVVEESPDADV